MADEYRIILQPEAYDGMESAYAYIERESPASAHKWAVGLMDAINSLDMFPARCPLAPESELFRHEIRQLLYGKGRNAYRILFTIQGDAVSILHIRHGAQDVLRSDD
ncbi:MAG: type II toxin-antitoxin system RelE/ParE family toxin [Capsulimonadaceae bacterium]